MPIDLPWCVYMRETPNLHSALLFILVVHYERSTAYEAECVAGRIVKTNGFYRRDALSPSTKDVIKTSAACWNGSMRKLWRFVGFVPPT